MAIKALVMMWWSANASAPFNGKCEQSSCKGPFWSNTIHTNACKSSTSSHRLPPEKQSSEIRRDTVAVLSSFVRIQLVLVKFVGSLWSHNQFIPCEKTVFLLPFFSTECAHLCFYWHHKKNTQHIRNIKESGQCY